MGITFSNYAGLLRRNIRHNNQIRNLNNHTNTNSLTNTNSHINTNNNLRISSTITNRYISRRSNSRIKRREYLKRSYALKKNKRNRPKKNKSYNFECCVCYSKNINKKKLIPCNHDLCKTCYSKLNNFKKCPICRRSLSPYVTTYNHRL